MTLFSSYIDDADHPDYIAKLNQQIQLIAQLDALPDRERRAPIRNCMHTIGNLFLDYFQTHLQVAQKYAEYNQETLSRVTQLVQQYYVADLENFLQGTFEGYEEWKLVSRQRTNIECFNGMFSGVVDVLDTQEIDEYMQQRKNVEGIDQSQVPENMPKSHWWWYV